MRTTIPIRLFVCVCLVGSFLLQSCINMNQPEAAAKSGGKQIVDSTANYLIKVNYPDEPQDEKMG